MLGSLLTLIRKKRRLSKATISRDAGIDIGFLTHIEKEERSPSHKTLMRICDSLDIPYLPIMYTYDKEYVFEDNYFDVIDHIAYDKIPVINAIDGFVSCPSDTKTAAFAMKMPDDSMEPIFPKDSYVFIEPNFPINDGDYGLFCYNDKYYIRELVLKHDSIFLHPLKRDFLDIRILHKKNLLILGKVMSSAFFD